MIPSWLLLLISATYVGLLLAVAGYGERHAMPSKLRPAIYALALAVYCSSWTFYGAVGTAARTGMGFLPIYLGPLLLLAFGWRILERLILISNEHRIVSIADFLSSRYGRVPGLAALVALLAQIFDEFTRFAAPDQDERGLGLGLSIYQRIARILDHRLQVSSRVGRGSQFSIVVPRIDAAAAGQAVIHRERPLPADNGLAGLKVLCIDNDPDILDGMSALLSQWQVDVEVATDVDAALQSLMRQRPQVVLVDYHLHDRMDGLTLLDALRDVAGTVLPAALLTGDGSDAVKQAAKARGCVLLTKPIKPTSLRAYLTSVRG